MSRQLKICFAFVILVLCIMYVGLFVWEQRFLVAYRSTWYITLSALITAICISVISQKTALGRISVRCTVYTGILAYLVLFMIPTLRTHRPFPYEPGVYPNIWGYALIPFGDVEVYQLPGEEGMRTRNLVDLQTYRKFIVLGGFCLLTSGIPTYIHLAMAGKKKQSA